MLMCLSKQYRICVDVRLHMGISMAVGVQHPEKTASPWAECGTADTLDIVFRKSTLSGCSLEPSQEVPAHSLLQGLAAWMRD